MSIRDYTEEQLNLFMTQKDRELQQYDKSIEYCLHTRNYSAMIVLAQKALAIKTQTLDTLIF